MMCKVNFGLKWTDFNDKITTKRPAEESLLKWKIRVVQKVGFVGTFCIFDRILKRNIFIENNESSTKVIFVCQLL